MDEGKARQSLRMMIKRYETKKSAAMALNISAVYLHDMLKGNRRIPDRILAKLGLQRKTSLIGRS